jgi:hypothetical protein
MSKFSGAHLNLSKFSSAPVFGGRRLLHNNFQVVLGGHVRLASLAPSLRSSRLHRANKGAGRRNGAHGRARCRGRDSVYARWWIAREPLAPSPPSSARVRPSSMLEPAAAAAGGGRGVVLAPLPQALAHPAVTEAGSVLSAA